MLTGMVRAWAWAIGRLRQRETLLPAPKPRTVPWGFGSILLVLLVWLVVNLGVMTAYSAATGRQASASLAAVGAKSKPSAGVLSFTEQMLLLSLANGLLLLAIPPLLRVTSGARLGDLGLERRGLARSATVGAVGFLLVAPVVYASNFLAVLIWKPSTHPVEKMVRSESSQGIAQLAILSAVLLAPAAEELIFRAIVQGWLIKFFERSRTKTLVAADPLAEVIVDPSSPPAAEIAAPPPDPLDRASMQAIVLTSSLFALVHLPQWPAPLAIFLLSLGLGVVYYRTGSLISAIVMHALFNSLGTLVLLGGSFEREAAAGNAKPAAGCIGFPASAAARPLD
jgi:membrane protease YdiL (CAAX protease family)